MSKDTLYRIRFYHQEEIYEIYCKSVCESDMFGFMEVSEFVFGETTALVVDTAEERLKMEFSGVKRTYIPMQAVIRIDEVDRQGVSKILDSNQSKGTVSPFPLLNKRKD